METGTKDEVKFYKLLNQEQRNIAAINFERYLR